MVKCEPLIISKGYYWYHDNYFFINKMFKLRKDLP